MISTFAGRILSVVVNATWQAAILAALILLLQRLFRGWLPARWRFALWFLVLVRFSAVPLPQCRWSIFNLIPRPTPSPSVAALPVAQPAPEAIPQVAWSQALRDFSEIAQSAAALPLDQPPLVQPPVDEPTPPVISQAAASQVPLEPLKIDRPFIPPAPKHVARSISKPISWPSVFLCAYAMGALCVFLRLLLASWSLRRMLRDAEPVTDSAMLRSLDAARQLLGIRRQIPLLATSQLSSPALVGLLHPRILIPENLLATFTQRELHLVLLHECAHVRRCDLLVNYWFAAVSILHWFNPLVWLILPSVRADRELACDETVLLRTADRESLGCMLLKLVNSNSPARLGTGGVGIFETRSFFKRRIQMIANFRRTRSWLVVPAMGLFAMVAAATLTTAVSRAADPQLAAQSVQKSDADYIHDLNSDDVVVRDAATEALVNPSRYFNKMNGGGVSPNDAYRNKLLAQLQDSLTHAGPVGKFRTRFVMAWIKGQVQGPHQSLLSSEIHYLDDGGRDAAAARKAHYYWGDEAGPDALLAGVHYLEDHITDDSVAKFAPQEKFSEVYVAAPDKDSKWHFGIYYMASGLMRPEENTPYDYNRGLVLSYDPAKKEIVKVKNEAGQGFYSSKEEYDAAMRQEWAQVQKDAPHKSDEQIRKEDMRKRIEKLELELDLLKGDVEAAPANAAQSAAKSSAATPKTSAGGSDGNVLAQVLMQPGAAIQNSTDYIRNLDSKEVAVRDAAMEALVVTGRFHYSVLYTDKPRQMTGGSDNLITEIDDKLLAQIHDSLKSFGPVGQFRARMTEAWIKGNVRFDDKGRAAFLAGVHYLEDHLNDAAVAKFAPQEDFTNVTVERDSDGKWGFIIESVSPRSIWSKRGLTLYYDLQKKQIVDVQYWESTQEYKSGLAPAPQPQEEMAQRNTDIMTRAIARRALVNSVDANPAIGKSTADYIRDLDSKDVAVRDKAMKALLKSPNKEDMSINPQTGRCRLDDQLENSLAHAGPVGQFRARLIETWFSGNVHFRGDGRDALMAGVRYLDDHINDTSVAKFFSQFARNDMAVLNVDVAPDEDGAGQWSITMVGGGKGTLTLYYDPQKKEIVKVQNGSPGN